MTQQPTSHFRLLRRFRALAVVCMAAAYLLSGLLHNSCDLDFARTGGDVQIASIAHDGASHDDGGALAGHHCHSCFSVSVPASPAPAPVATTLAATLLSHATAALIDRAHGLDPPPPKTLT
ncbi:hypothetical protein IP86_26745 [Rhodopseudomonas sp. AAP120]|uniref:hypothetical protein n=1 Tax=Rhodopseudomonas sp. AAP120 TaxID=1523430 RepID=UPI0006CC5C20|nr:hypothetical protein [Rhodopseudomonas sp. AAP120]KPF89983.1 hypothetical protein IP86_26745 [Rhodopseudomonas sp. AAP120]